MFSVYARERLNDMAFNHVVRSWLFGFVIAGKIPELKDRDLEVHSISAILHDLGWDTTGELVSKDKRFEVDGANAARDFLKSEAVGDTWDSRRLQLVWDAIALHTTPSIASYKEPEVVATSNGISSDFGGPKGPFGRFLTEEEYQKIVDELPRLGLKEGVREIMCGLCRDKPETTVSVLDCPCFLLFRCRIWLCGVDFHQQYDNFVGQYGERFVDGYSLAGHQTIDMLENLTLP